MQVFVGYFQGSYIFFSELFDGVGGDFVVIFDNDIVIVGIDEVIGCFCVFQMCVIKWYLLGVVFLLGVIDLFVECIEDFFVIEVKCYQQ